MLQHFTRQLTTFKSRAPQLIGPTVQRHDACGMCGSRTGLFLSKADYWDLAEVSLIRCTQCGMMQLDPMLTEDVAAEGCLALYRHQQAGESDRSRKRGLYRAFRRGVAFGISLKLLRIRITRVLEVGAGGGYFLKGLQYIYPSASYTCVDVVSEVLEAMRVQHGFSTICSSVEKLDQTALPKFDLIIARDILEHVTQPAAALSNLNAALQPGGHFFFITPNGHQDAWQMFSRWKTDRVNSEILINHVNYFDPISLRRHLESLGLKIRKWFIYDLKTFSRGAGWKLIEQHKARVSSRRSAQRVIAETRDLSSTFKEANENPIPRLYSNPLLKWFMIAFCWYKHTSFIRVSPEACIGEEIYCLAQKPHLKAQ